MGVTSDKRGRWQAHGERAIYDSPWVWLGQVDVEPPGGDRYWHHVVRLRKAAVAANRELAEETGYRAGHLDHLVTFQPMPGTIDAEHYVYAGRSPLRVGDPTDLTEAARVEWVPLASVPGLIAAGEIWTAGSVAALPLLLMARASSNPDPSWQRVAESSRGPAGSTGSPPATDCPGNF